MRAVANVPPMRDRQAALLCGMRPLWPEPDLTPLVPAFDWQAWVDDARVVELESDYETSVERRVA